MITARVAEVRDRIARAAGRAGRDPGEVTLVAVSKLKPADDVRRAFDAGVRDFGENRLQEALAKIAALADLPGIRWHLVGHLQGNKARKAAAAFHLIHSLDSVELGQRLDRVGREQAHAVRALVQVDLAGEDSKFGVPEPELEPALASLAGGDGLALEGLMVMPPYEPEPERVRPFFRRLRELRDAAREQGRPVGGDLSMGMSHDFDVAIEEGATCVRVGTALFGARQTR